MNSKTSPFSVERLIKPALTFSPERDYFDYRLCSANSILGCEEGALVGFSKVCQVCLGSIAADAVRVLQRRVSGAPRKRQLATKIRHVVKCH
jgi:hypothetical protein